ncbi:hypothetical protein DIE01_16250 [Burkholderia sp. Bp8990]|nr:hypothetical protein DIE01_16250 [Burkholderia sp. Bp8990]
MSTVASVAAAPGVIERYGVMSLAVIAACAISFGAGYLYRAHVDTVKQASVTAAVKTADAVASAVVATADTKTDATLQKRLNAAQSRAAALQQQIDEARNANPPAADCRLPDGLRDALGAQLAGHSGQVQDAVQ